jgi:hypothetical protein
MVYQQIDPNLLGSGQPFSEELTQIALIPLDSNAYATVFIANTSNTQTTVVRLAVKNFFENVGAQHYILYDTEIVPQGMLIIPNLGLQSETQVLGYSNNGAATFNVTGDTIINVF